MHLIKAYRFTLLGIFFALSSPFVLMAQITVDTSYTPGELVSDVLLGSGVKVRNIYYRGAPQSIAHFKNGASEPDISEGILLTTGTAFDVLGPNQKHGNGKTLSRKGDQDLRSIARGNTYDAAVLEFDFISAKDSISFFYFFASEEYNEYVNSEFNDVFAFLISGPGYKRKTNLAVLPETKRPITINSVNNGASAKSYIDNNYWNDRGYPIKGRKEELNPILLENFQFDGMTVVLRARARVVPGKPYHIKIGIADVSDGRYDSAVFLEAHSFTSEPYDPLADKHLLKRRIDRGDTLPIVTEDSLPLPDTEEDTPLPEGIDPEKVLYRGFVEFAFDQSTLTPEAQSTLQEFLKNYRKNRKGKVVIWGHTDNIGNRSYNQALSNRRAKAVADWLSNEQVMPSVLQTEGFAFDRPKANNQTAAGRARNRRVEFIILRP